MQLHQRPNRTSPYANIDEAHKSIILYYVIHIPHRIEAFNGEIGFHQFKVLPISFQIIIRIEKQT